MLVAVTGASGFIGSHVVAALRSKGHSVRCLVRDPAKTEVALAMHGLEGDGEVDVAVADLTDSDALRRGLNGVDALVHAAALFSMNPSDAQRMAEVNPASVRSILEISEELALSRIVYVSTMGVYVPFSSDQVDQHAPLGTGFGPYSASKIEAEKVARDAVDRGAPVVSVYPGVVLGPRDPNPELSDSQVVVRDALKGKIPMSVKDANLPIIDVRDVAAVCAGAIDGGASRRYLVPGETKLLTDVISMLNDITGGNLKLRNAPSFVFTATGAIADGVSKLTKKKMPVTAESIRMLVEGAKRSGATIGWAEAKNDFGVPFFDTETTLRDTVTWLHSAGHLSDEEAGTAAS